MSDEIDFLDHNLVVTYERAKAELEAIEAKLAARYGLSGNVRSQLIEKDMANDLHEDEVVADWHGAFSWYLQYTEIPVYESGSHVWFSTPGTGASKGEVQKWQEARENRVSEYTIKPDFGGEEIVVEARNVLCLV